MPIGERIKAVRLAAGLTMEAFGEQVGVSKSFVSMVESGKANASDQTILFICREFGVNETWLRTGEGEMMVPRTDEEKITEFLDDVLASKPNVRRRLISALARLDPEDWDLIERMIEKVSGDEEKPAP